MTEDWGAPNKIAVLDFTSDNAGKVKVLRKQEMCEDVIRPFRKTVTLINRTWCADMKIDNPQYQKLDEITLYDLKFTENGYFEKEKLQRVTFVIPLKKADRQKVQP